MSDFCPASIAPLLERLEHASCNKQVVRLLRELSTGQDPTNRLKALGKTSKQDIEAISIEARTLICEIMFRFAVDYADTVAIEFEPPATVLQALLQSDNQSWLDWVKSQPIPLLDDARATETDSFKFSSKATGLVIKILDAFQTDEALHRMCAYILFRAQVQSNLPVCLIVGWQYACNSTHFLQKMTSAGLIRTVIQCFSIFLNRFSSVAGSSDLIQFVMHVLLDLQVKAPDAIASCWNSVDKDSIIALHDQLQLVMNLPNLHQEVLTSLALSVLLLWTSSSALLSRVDSVISVRNHLSNTWQQLLPSIFPLPTPLDFKLLSISESVKSDHILISRFWSHNVSSIQHAALLRACLCQIKPSADASGAVFVVQTALLMLWSILHGASTQNALRLYALHSLEFALRSLTAQFKYQNEQQTPVLSSVAENLTHWLPHIEALLTRSWGSSLRPIAQCGQELFALYIELTEAHALYLDSSRRFDWLPRLQLLLSRSTMTPCLSKCELYPLDALLPKIGASRVLQVEPQFLSVLLRSCSDSTSRPLATALLKQTMLLSHRESTDSRAQWPSLFMPTLVEGSFDDNIEIRRSAGSSILQVALSCEPRVLNDVVKSIQTHQMHNDQLEFARLRALISVLQSARACITLPASLFFGDAESEPIMPLALLHQALVHQEITLRQAALTLVCTCTRVSDPVSAWELDCVRGCLPALIKISSNAESDSLVRAISKLVMRIRDSTARAMSANTASTADISTSVEFVLWLERFAMSNMYPGAPYERLLTALKLYERLMLDWSRAGSALPNVPFATESNCSRLFACATHGWLRVREIGARVLASMSPLPGWSSVPFDLFCSVLKQCQSPRLDDVHAAVAAIRVIFRECVCYRKLRLPWSTSFLAIMDEREVVNSVSEMDTPELAILDFVSQISEIISTAHQRHMDHQQLHQNSDLAAGDAAASLFSYRVRIHGLLALFRTCLSDLPAASLASVDFTPLFESLCGITSLALKVHTAPALRGCDLVQNFESDSEDDSDADGDDDDENEDLNDTEFDHTAMHRRLIMVLAFLAVKEGCMTLSTLMSTMPATSKRVDVQLGANAIVNVLMRSRHVGSVQCGYKSLAAAARALVQSGDQHHIEFIQQQLQTLLSAVENNTIGSQFGATWIRRSFGLPFAILALLQSETTHHQNSSATLVASVNRLISMATQSSSWMSRVHALNILTVLFRDSQLVDGMQLFISLAFDLVLDSESTAAVSDIEGVFALKNSRTMCFRHLVTRLLGSTNKRSNDISAVDVFHSHPPLHALLLKHIQACASAPMTMSPPSSLMPCLLVMSLFRPPPSDSQDDQQLQEFVNPLQVCASHPIHLIRKAAARALDSVISGSAFSSTLAELWNSLTLSMTSNAMEGSLLCIEQLLLSLPIRYDSADSAIQQVLNQSFHSLSNLAWICSLKASPVKMVLLRVIGLFIFLLKGKSHSVAFEFGLSMLQQHEINVPGEFKCRREAAKLCLSTCSFVMESSQIQLLLLQLLSDECVDVQLETLHWLLQCPTSLFNQSICQSLLNIATSNCSITGSSSLVRCAALNALSRLPVSSFTTSDIDSTMQLLLLNVEGNGNTALANASLEFLGVCAEHAIADNHQALIESWIQLVRRFAADDQPTASRLSVCRSLASSGLLKLDLDGSHSYAQLLVAGWLILIELMQDDQEHVRNFATDIVISVLQQSRIGALVLFDALQLLCSSQAAASGSTFIAHAVRTLLDCAHVSVAQANSDSSVVAVASTLFGGERRNAFVESLLVSQLWLHALVSFLRSHTLSQAQHDILQNTWTSVYSTLFASELNSNCSFEVARSLAGTYHVLYWWKLQNADPSEVLQQHQTLLGAIPADGELRALIELPAMQSLDHLPTEFTFLLPSLLSHP